MNVEAPGILSIRLGATGRGFTPMFIMSLRFVEGRERLLTQRPNRLYGLLVGKRPP